MTSEKGPEALRALKETLPTELNNLVEAIDSQGAEPGLTQIMAHIQISNEVEGSSKIDQAEWNRIVASLDRVADRIVELVAAAEANKLAESASYFWRMDVVDTVVEITNDLLGDFTVNAKFAGLEGHKDLSLRYRQASTKRILIEMVESKLSSSSKQEGVESEKETKSEEKESAFDRLADDIKEQIEDTSGALKNFFKALVISLDKESPSGRGLSEDERKNLIFLGKRAVEVSTDTAVEKALGVVFALLIGGIIDDVILSWLTKIFGKEDDQDQAPPPPAGAGATAGTATPPPAGAGGAGTGPGTGAGATTPPPPPPGGPGGPGAPPPPTGAGGAYDHDNTPEGFYRDNYHEPMPHDANREGMTHWFLEQIEYIYEQFDEETAVRLALEEADKYILNYFGSNAGFGWANIDHFQGLSDALKDFGLPESRQKGRVKGHENFSQENRETMANKSMEMLYLSFIEQLALGNQESLVSDWKATAEMDHSAEEDFSIESLDWMMQPEYTEAFGGYKHRKLMKWVQHEAPFWIKEFEIMNEAEREGITEIRLEGSFWNDKEARPWMDGFQRFIKFKIDSLKNELEGLGAGESHIVNTQAGFMGGDSIKIEFRKEDLDPEEFTDTDEQIFLKAATKIGTVIGVRQYTFMIDHCKGTTPSDLMLKHIQWVRATSPESYYRYRQYKDLGIVPTAEVFRIEWEGSKKSKKQKVEDSEALTREFIDMIAPIREPLPAIGKLTDVDANYRSTYMQTAHPSMYEYALLRFHERHHDKPAALGAFIAGVDAYDTFVSECLKIPGLKDADDIKSMESLLDKIDGMTKEELRDRIIDEDFKSILRNLVSPLKANQSWFRWEHVAQYILMYADKCMRVYALKDETEDGQVELMSDIRNLIKQNSENLSVKTAELQAMRADGEGLAFDKPGHESAFMGSFGAGKVEGKRVADPDDRKFDYDVRDYVLNRLARTPEGIAGSLVNKFAHLMYPAIVDPSTEQLRKLFLPSNSEKRGKPLSRDGVIKAFSSIKNVSKTASVIMTKWFDNDATENFFNHQLQFIFGMPKAEQVRTPDDDSH